MAEEKKSGENLLIKPQREFSASAHIKSRNQYNKIYNESLNEPGKFWERYAKELHWFKQWTKVRSGEKLTDKWFINGKTNITYNCLDVHANSERKNKAALIFQSEDGNVEVFTYNILLNYVNRFANALKKLGIKKGDNVAIYMGSTPELIIAILACGRIGAVHTTLFIGLNYIALKNRLTLIEPKVIITSDNIMNSGVKFPLKKQIDKICDQLSTVERIIVHKRIESDQLELNSDKEVIFQKIILDESKDCKAEEVDSSHPLFNFFTSVKDRPVYPVEMLTGGFMVQNYLAAKWVFDFKNDDIFWMAVNPGWMEGLTFSVYGALLNGVTTFLFEGNHSYPDEGIYGRIIEEQSITNFCSTPSTFKALKGVEGNRIIKRDLSNLRLISTICEPLDEITFKWIFKKMGKENIPVINNWFLKETGTIVTSTLPGAIPVLPGFTGLPLPGFQLNVFNVEGEQSKNGYIVIKNNFPSRPKFKDNDNLFYKSFDDSFFTKESGEFGKDKYLKLTGRVDNIINISGYKYCKKEIENILIQHDAVDEVFILPYPDKLKGEGIAAFILLNMDFEESLLLKEELRNYVSEKYSNFTKPGYIIFINEIEKDDEGKVIENKLIEILKEVDSSIDFDKYYLFSEELRRKLSG